MATSIEEYRKGRSKTVVVPSGATFLIRKISPVTLAKFLDTIQIALPRSKKTEDFKRAVDEVMALPGQAKKLVDGMLIIVVGSVISPKITMSETPQSDELSFIEIDPADLTMLFTEVMNFSGLSAEETEEQESFRQE